MSTDLLAIGEGMRDAYGKSLTDGHKYMNGYFGGRGLRVYHVPALPGDGTLVPPEQVGKGVDDEIAFLSKIDFKMIVGEIRLIDDETLLVEATQSCRTADGVEHSFANNQVWTFRDGFFERVIEVASPELFATFGAALAAAGVIAHPDGGLVEAN